MRLRRPLRQERVRARRRRRAASRGRRGSRASSRRTAAPASARVCARRIFEAATSSIAFVILAVDVTERTRRWICRTRCHLASSPQLVSCQPTAARLATRRLVRHRVLELGDAGFSSVSRSRRCSAFSSMIFAAISGLLLSMYLWNAASKRLHLLDRHVVQEAVVQRRRRSRPAAPSTAAGTAAASGAPCARCPRSSWRTRRRVEVARAELRERLQLAVTAPGPAQRAGDLLHRLALRRTAHARHRDADVDRRADTGVEQVGLEEDLAVGDRDDVRRDVGRDVVRLRLDDRQRRDRAAAVLRRRACAARSSRRLCR